MELAAAEMARLIEEKIVLSGTAVDRVWRQTPQEVKNLGDIAMMLKLRQNQGVFGEEVVTIRPVTDAAGVPWQPDPAAEVLVLGDSFANIYSLDMMNWGAAAGLAEQLSFALHRPVDTILRNDEGAFATREMLSRELAQGEDRLAGKKVVVWQFAARELAVGDWKLLDMTLKPPSKHGRRYATGGRRVDRQRDDRCEIGGPAGRPNSLRAPHLHPRLDRLAGAQRDAHRAEDRRVPVQPA